MGEERFLLFPFFEELLRESSREQVVRSLFVAIASRDSLPRDALSSASDSLPRDNASGHVAFQVWLLQRMHVEPWRLLHGCFEELLRDVVRQHLVRIVVLGGGAKAQADFPGSGVDPGRCLGGAKSDC